MKNRVIGLRMRIEVHCAKAENPIVELESTIFRRCAISKNGVYGLLSRFLKPFRKCIMCVFEPKTRFLHIRTTKSHTPMGPSQGPPAGGLPRHLSFFLRADKKTQGCVALRPRGSVGVPC